jgi:hypothetical protein
MKSIITENKSYRTIMECSKIEITGDYSLVLKGVHTMKDGSEHETVKTMVFMSPQELSNFKSFVNSIDE